VCSTLPARGSFYDILWDPLPGIPVVHRSQKQPSKPIRYLLGKNVFHRCRRCHHQQRSPTTSRYGSRADQGFADTYSEQWNLASNIPSTRNTVAELATSARSRTGLPFRWNVDDCSTPGLPGMQRVGIAAAILLRVFRSGCRVRELQRLTPSFNASFPAGSTFWQTTHGPKPSPTPWRGSEHAVESNGVSLDCDKGLGQLQRAATADGRHRVGLPLGRGKRLLGAVSPSGTACGRMAADVIAIFRPGIRSRSMLPTTLPIL